MMKFTTLAITFTLLIFFLPAGAAVGAEWVMPATPLPMAQLFQELSYVRGESGSEPEVAQAWPRRISFSHRVYDYRSESFQIKTENVALDRAPLRIIPHAVGVSEILWAICPRSRLLMFSEVAADPRFSLIATELAKSGRIFSYKESELVIAAQPDIVFTVAFSDAVFKQRLHRAGIPTLDLGSQDSLDAIIEEIRLLGQVLDESANAEALLNLIAGKRALLQAALPVREKPLRLLYYDLGGYLPGAVSNFTSLCKLVGAVNVGAEQGIKSWKQVDHETILQWDPEIIIVPAESNLAVTLKLDPLLRYARAVKNDRVLTMPGCYLCLNSQFLLLGANLLAGIIYPDEF
ncbi:MAG: ABC transporter substrate-binding protein [Deltaproteobacteria bacterium]|nr:ABC transporter substrate-binding protein [Deltaproteobacteria bacterium]